MIINVYSTLYSTDILLTIMRNELLFGILAAVLVLGMVSLTENVQAKKKPTYKVGRKGRLSVILTS